MNFGGGPPGGPMNPYASGPDFFQADEFNVHVDPLGNVGVFARDLMTVETPNHILEDMRAGCFLQGSQAFDLTSDLEVIGPGLRMISLTDL